eukprot:TRINITY_DN17123_c0_g1_i1.p1 TRINITY_DN17123_c0_g1~~TRINITY_DN17123_c0_g1_i1.p1  ORF type:complete len:2480 (+),score=726.24 TRINITY_DN17123_c0_g1_i1:506-7441(+)
MASLHDDLILVAASRAGHAFVAARVAFGSRVRPPRDGAGTPTTGQHRSPSTERLTAAPTPTDKQGSGSDQDSVPGSDCSLGAAASAAPTVGSRRTAGAPPLPAVTATSDTSLPLHAVTLHLRSPCGCVSRGSLRGGLRSIGGVLGIISIISAARSQRARVTAMRTLVKLMYRSPENTQSMQSFGYMALAWYLRCPRVVPDADVLSLCFAFAGADTADPAAGVLSDVHAVRYLLMDWRIWSRAGGDVQAALLSRMHALATASTFGAANRMVLVHAGVHSWLLRLTLSIAVPQNVDPSGSLMPVALHGHVLQVVSSLAGAADKPCMGSLRSLLSHLLYAKPFVVAASSPTVDDERWRVAWVCVWVFFLARCDERAVATLLAERGTEVFVGLLNEPNPRTRFLTLLSIAVMMRHPGPRATLQSTGIAELLLQGYWTIRKSPWAAGHSHPLRHLNAADASTEEAVLLLAMLTRGPAGSRRAGEWGPAVQQPLLPALFLDAFEGLIGGHLRGEEEACRTLLTAGLEVLAACGAGRRASAVVGLHADPSSALTKAFHEKTAVLHGHESADSLYPALLSVLEELRSAAADRIQDVGQRSPLPPPAPGTAKLAMPDLLSTLTLLASGWMRRMPVGPLTLAAADQAFKRRLVVDALQQLFRHGTAQVRAQFVDRNVHLSLVSLLSPRPSRTDSVFMSLVVGLVGDLLAWGCMPQAEGQQDGVPGFLEGVLDAVLAQFEHETDTSRTLRFAADFGWVAHVQQLLLHSVLMAYHGRIQQPDVPPYVLASFAMVADVTADTMAMWRVYGKGGGEPRARHRTFPDPCDDDGYDVSRLTGPGLIMLAAVAAPGLDYLAALLLSAVDTDVAEYVMVREAAEAAPPAGRPRSNATHELEESFVNPTAGTAPVWVVPPRQRRGGDTRLAIAGALLREDLALLHSSESGRRAASPQPRHRARSPSRRADAAHHRARSTAPRRLSDPPPDDAPASAASVEELLGGLEDPRYFPFWMADVVQRALGKVSTTTAPAGLASRIANKLGGNQTEVSLQKTLRRLLTELLSPLPHAARHPLMASNDACGTFVMVTLTCSSATGGAAEPASIDRGPVWCSEWWVPVCHELDPCCLLAACAARDGDEPTFTQQVLMATAPQLSSATGLLHALTVRVWRYLVEVKSAAVRKALLPAALPDPAERKARGRRRSASGAVGDHALLLLLGGHPRPHASAPAKLLLPAFVARLGKAVEASAVGTRKRQEQRLHAARPVLQDHCVSSQSRRPYRRRVNQGANSIRDGAWAVNKATAVTLEQLRLKEREARGIVGRLVRRRLLLQDLWGEAAAVYTAHDVRSRMRWRLDDVEGPDRMRVRLKKFFAEPLIERLSFVESAAAGGAAPTPTDDGDELEALLSHKFDPGINPLPAAAAGDTPRSFTCAQITPMAKVTGELLFYRRALYFVSDDSPYRDDIEVGSPRQRQPRARPTGQAEMVHEMHLNAVRHRVTFWYNEVSGVFRRRYLLVNNSLEVFTERGLTLFFAFQTEAERDRVYSEILAECPRAKEMSLTAENLKRWQGHWVHGRLTNFQYIMWLNTMAGRSFNDLTQYPVFPHVLADFSSETLDVRESSIYRDLSLPMGCQTSSRREKVALKFSQTAEMYRIAKGEDPPLPGPVKRRGGGFRIPEFLVPEWLLKNRQRDTGDDHCVDLFTLPPYHHGSHFSNRATVLYYCIRLQPFSDYFCELNGLKLDVPDRTFHSAEMAYRLSSSVSTSDVKELTPEFYYLPDFLVNRNRIVFGNKQDKLPVDDVELPPWAGGSPRRFVMQQRSALESEWVSRNLHNWIDLVFGYKLSGQPAIDAMNCFHPYSYEGAVNVDEIDDPVLRQSTIDIINNFGQMPEQLFTRPHPRRDVERIFGERGAAWWQPSRPQKKLHEAAADGVGLVILRVEHRKAGIRALQVDVQPAESATTRGFDTVADDDADDDVLSAADCRLILVHPSHENADAAPTYRLSPETLQHLTWDNSIRVYLYEGGRRSQGREVLALRQSTRVDTYISAATSRRGEAGFIAFGTDLGVVEVYRYGVRVPASPVRRRREADAFADWYNPQDKGLRVLSPKERHWEAGNGAGGVLSEDVVAGTLRTVDDDDGRRRTLRHAATLHGHCAAVATLTVSREFNLIVSGGADGTLILWDLVDLVFMRSLQPAEAVMPGSGAGSPGVSPRIVLLEVNPQNGDVLCAWGAAHGGFAIALFTVNFEPVAKRLMQTCPHCAHFSGSALFVGTDRGRILSLVATDLSDLGSPLQLRTDQPVTALTGNDRHTRLYSAHQTVNSMGTVHGMISTWAAGSAK